jgi:hypothetical protein
MEIGQAGDAVRGGEAETGNSMHARQNRHFFSRSGRATVRRPAPLLNRVAGAIFTTPLCRAARTVWIPYSRLDRVATLFRPDSGRKGSIAEGPLLDLFFIAGVLAFFAAGNLFVHICERL